MIPWPRNLTLPSGTFVLPPAVNDSPAPVILNLWVDKFELLMESTEASRRAFNLKVKQLRTAPVL